MKVFGAQNDLIITLEGAERFWAVKSKIILPRASIADIEYDPARPPKKMLALQFFKLPGSVLPGIMFAGTFVKRGERDFWYIRMRYDGVISIKTKKDSFNYDRIMLSCSAEIAQDVVDWWKDK